MSYLIWPLCVLGSLLGFLFAHERGWTDERQMIVPGVAVVVLFLLERLVPRGGRRQGIRARFFLKDVGHNVIGTFGTPLGEILFLGVAAFLAGRLSEAWGGTLWPTHWPYALQAFALVFIGDGLECLRHRWAHNTPLLWRLHSLHHSMQELNVMKSGRGHILDFAARALFVFAPLVALGAPAELLWWYPAAVTILGPVSHSNLDLHVPRLAHSLVLTPQLHRIHHASDLELAHSNFAAVFPVWDMLFGSYRRPRSDEDPAVGIENDPMPDSFVGQLASPFL